MNFKTTGEVIDGFHVTGSHEVHSYLLDGLQPVIFDAGFACFGPSYLRDIKAVLGERRPSDLFITHSHFDHCGSAAYLQKNLAGLSISASQKAADILARPNARKLIAELNQAAGDLARQWHPELGDTPPFEPFTVDRILAHGDQVELEGGLTIEVIATPGHTWDFLSYYIPQKRILVSSEAVGCPDFTGDYIVTEFLVDYDVYMESMARLAELEIEVLCPSHGAVLTGADAAGFIARSQQAAKDFKARVEALLHEEGGDIERTAARFKTEEWDPKPMPKQPLPAYMLNLLARVRHLAHRMEQA